VIEQQGAGRVLDFLLGTSTSITCSPLPFPFACFKLHRSPAGPPFSPPLCVNQCQMGWAGGRQSTLLTQSLTAANDNAQPAARTPFTPTILPPFKTPPVAKEKTKQCIKKVKVKLCRIRRNMNRMRSSRSRRSWSRGIQSHSLS